MSILRVQSIGIYRTYGYHTVENRENTVCISIRWEGVGGGNDLWGHVESSDLVGGSRALVGFIRKVLLEA